MTGGGKITLALGSVRKQATVLNGVKRPHAVLREDEDDGHDDGRAQTVSHFDRAAGGAIDASKTKRDDAPMVITAQVNWDWKEASRRKRQRNGLPVEVQLDGGVSGQAVKEMDGRKPAYGLQGGGGQDHTVSGHNVRRETEDTQPARAKTNGEAPPQPKTDDELAMDALLGKTTKPDLVLPAVSTEEEAFHRDYTNAPDMATLDDYARVPVEQFGAALLRGMGWKDGEGIGAERGKKVEHAKLPERRPALLGIGAKEEKAVAQELGAWGKSAIAKGGKGRGKEVVYNPVLVRDKRTGELFTEEELQGKREREEKESFEEEFERRERRRKREETGGYESKGRDGDRERREEDHRRERSRRKRDEEDEYDSRDQHEDRERREKKGRIERNDDRERRRHDPSEEEYYRRKEKERRRRREREESDYDSARSRRHDSDRERHKNKDRRAHDR